MSATFLEQCPPNSQLVSGSLGNEQEGRVAKRSVDRAHAALGGSPPFPFHQLAGPLNRQARSLTGFPCPFQLGSHRAVACETPAVVEQTCRCGDGGWVVRQIKHDGVDAFGGLRDRINHLLDPADEMEMGWKFVPAMFGPFEVLQGHFSVFCSGL